MNPLAQQYQLITSLKDPAVFPHPVSHIEVIETHISWVILTGPYAYKLKKHLDYGFLDYASLQKRRQYCQEELRLNGRYSTGLYLQVVTITGSYDKPEIDGAGDVIDYAVKMTEFEQRCLLDEVISRGELGDKHIDALALALDDFHHMAKVAGDDAMNNTLTVTPDFGSVAAVAEPVIENFNQLQILSIATETDATQQRLQSLRLWSETQLKKLTQQLDGRQRDGFIRECHGDLHLGNMAMIDGCITFFDGIEFNEQFRWIDIMSELAYLLMDLESRGHECAASRLLNRYMEYCGDYSGLPLLNFYKVYRAIVRAKVAALRLNQANLENDEQQRCSDDFHRYLQLASAYTQESPLFLAITHGLSASGKTTYSGLIAEQCHAIHLRSDIVRKRLHGLSPLSDSHSLPGQGIYSRLASRQTFAYLETTARLLVQAQFPVIVDATFLSSDLRLRFKALAKQLHVPFVIIDCQSNEAELIRRLKKRRPGMDASEANVDVLTFQQGHDDKLSEEELPYTYVIDSSRILSMDNYQQFISQQQH